MSVLRQAAVSHLRESELPLDDAERVFHLCPYPGLRAVLRAFLRCQPAVARSLRLGEIPRRRRRLRQHGLLTRIGRVSPDPRLVTMQQVRQNPGVVDIRRRGHHRMDQLAATVHPDMRLHAEVPLPALARGVHLRVPFLLPVLRRTRCVDDAGIHDRAPVHLQPVLGQVDIDQAEQAISQVVPFHEVAELADGGLVRRGFPAEVDTHEPAHRQGVVQSLLGSRIREIEPVLKEVDAQHPFDSDRPPACTLRLRIERLDGLGQLLPGNDLVHVIQETFLAGLFVVLVEAGIGKRGLAHG